MLRLPPWVDWLVAMVLGVLVLTVLPTPAIPINTLVTLVPITFAWSVPLTPVLFRSTGPVLEVLVPWLKMAVVRCVVASVLIVAR